jgi:hypothetical protein
MTTAMLSLVPIFVVTAGVVVAILLFEKKRAEQIEADRHRDRRRPSGPATRQEPPASEREGRRDS